METISAGVLAEAISRAPSDQYVIWTGHEYGSWQRSLRSRALAEIKKVARPVALRELLRRAARIDGELGFNPDTVRSGLRLHQGAKPAVYLLVEQTPVGDYVAVTTVPFAGPAFRRIEKGAVVLDRSGRSTVECAAPDGSHPPQVEGRPVAARLLGALPRPASTWSAQPDAAGLHRPIEQTAGNIHGRHVPVSRSGPPAATDLSVLNRWRAEDLAADRPRSLGDVECRQRRRAMLALPHVAPLAGFAARLSAAKPGTEVPEFDPLDAGIHARTLFLFEKPGPMAGSSGFISRNNEDRTAEATYQFMLAAGIPREATCLWNLIPWWNGTRQVTAAELQRGTRCVSELVDLLPSLRVVVLVGLSAARAAHDLRRCGLAVVSSYHPSPINRAAAPAKWNGIPTAWAEVRALIA
jgi:hypothetical protein